MGRVGRRVESGGEVRVRGVVDGEVGRVWEEVVEEMRSEVQITRRRAGAVKGGMELLWKWP
jgi:hypothetical protein